MGKTKIKKKKKKIQLSNKWKKKNMEKLPHSNVESCYYFLPGKKTS